MKIIELKSSNIKRLKAVELNLDDKQNLVLVTGRNGQGKTSLIDSIWMALGGKKAMPVKPIRDGEEKGEIELNLDGYKVTRTFTDKGTYLKVTNKEGAAYSNAQEFLNYIIGNLSFDPLAFSRLEPRKQVGELITITGLDFTKLEDKKKQLIDDRLLIGREMKTIVKYTPEQIKEAEENAKKEEVSIKNLSEKYNQELEKRNTYERSRNTIEVNKTTVDSLKKQIQEIEGQIKTLESQNIELAKVEDTKEDLKDIQEQINNAEEINKGIAESKRILEEAKKVKEKDEQYKTLTNSIKAKEEEKAKKLSETKMPIENLSFSEETVLYNNIPYSQLSGAEQLKVSMAIAMASNPKLKVILIRDGSLLDKDNLKVIDEMAQNKDFQVWIEKVDDSGKIGIYIEEGEIKTIN